LVFSSNWDFDWDSFQEVKEKNPPENKQPQEISESNSKLAKENNSLNSEKVNNNKEPSTNIKI